MICAGPSGCDDTKRAPDGRPHDYFWELFDEACCLERDVCTTLLHRLETLRRDFDGDLLADFRDKNRLLLEVYQTAALARRVEFSRTCAV